MTIEVNGSELDLDAILAARWADPHVFSAAEFARAEAFWRARRAQDEELLAVRRRPQTLWATGQDVSHETSGRSGCG
jgi:hypothetical protein